VDSGCEGIVIFTKFMGGLEIELKHTYLKAELWERTLKKWNTVLKTWNYLFLQRQLKYDRTSLIARPMILS